MGGVAGSGIGQGLVNTGIKMGGVAPQPTVGTEYTPVTPNVYNPAFNSQQTSNPFNAEFTGVADYNPAAQNVPRVFAGEAPKPGQMNFELTDAQRANLLAQQAVQQQPTQPTQPAPQVSPVVQQMMMRQQPMFNPQMQRLQGLQQLYSMFSRPQMRMPMQMPMYRSPALAYRPNIQQVQQNLGRVKPSVYKSELDAARARIAELEGQRGGE